MAPSQKIQVVVVTDNPALREEFEFGFPAEVEVVHAREARDAWRWLATAAPTAVIVDLQTGSAGGYGLARDMRMSSRLSEVPIVILLDRYQDTWLARQAGADAVFVKPVEVGALMDAITTATSGSAA